MPKSKIPATGGAMPATAHPDAALITLVDKTLEAERHLYGALEKRDAAEERGKPIATPDAVIKTEEDTRLRLFRGHGAGYPYHDDEIAALRAWHRADGRRTVGEGSFAARERASKILDAWADWRDARRREEERVGLDKAEGAYREGAQVHSDLLAAVLKTRAATLDRAMAKLKAGVGWLPLGDGLDDEIRNGLRLYGPGEDTISFSIVRDLLAISGLLGGRQ
jgi:hypothetical protein